MLKCLLHISLMSLAKSLRSENSCTICIRGEGGREGGAREGGEGGERDMNQISTFPLPHPTNNSHTTTTYPFHRLLPSPLEVLRGQVLGEKGFAFLNLLEEGPEGAGLDSIQLVVLDQHRQPSM